MWELCATFEDTTIPRLDSRCWVRRWLRQARRLQTLADYRVRRVKRIEPSPPAKQREQQLARVTYILANAKDS